MCVWICPYNTWIDNTSGFDIVNRNDSKDVANKIIHTDMLSTQQAFKCI